MSDKQYLKGINFPGLDGTYFVPQIDETLSNSGDAADAKVVGDALKNTVGKKTDDGGEIFNDYENNVAACAYAHAEGYKTVAGGEASHTEGYNTATVAATKFGYLMTGYEIEDGSSSVKIALTNVSGLAAAGHLLFDTDSDLDKIAVMIIANVNKEESTITADLYQEDIEIINEISFENLTRRFIYIPENPEFGPVARDGALYAHAEGYNTVSEAQGAHAEGTHTKAIGDSAHAEGYSTVAQRNQAHAEGYKTIAGGEASHVEGYGTKTGETFEFEILSKGWTTEPEQEEYHTVLYLDSVEGLEINQNVTFDTSSDVLNDLLDPIFISSINLEDNSIVVEGRGQDAWQIAITDFSALSRKFLYIYGQPTLGSVARSGGDFAHAEGKNTTARGVGSHTEGIDTEAIGQASHASGLGTIASADNQTAIGQYNAEDANAIFIVGNGKNGNERHNAFTINKEDGSANFFGNIILTENITYGTELPEAGTVGRLFFKVVE